MKIVKSLEESGLLTQGISKTIKNEAKEQKRRVSRNVIRHVRCYFFLGIYYQTNALLEQVKAQLELVKAQLEQDRFFDVA